MATNFITAVGRRKTAIASIRMQKADKASLTVNGKLIFADDRDLSLTSEWIYLAGGELAIGSEARPYTHKATITPTDTVPR